ncbi:MAG TPA: L-aspartate oxidase [Acidobacteriaceae bacterium]|nr:L-aspartate oxidase [Acidobacteriaceae bacterium]
MSARKRIVVMGSGIAGLIAALELSAKHDVTLVTKSELMESNTRYAQGGIAAAMFADDSIAEHVADTMRAGAGLCRIAAVEVLCAEGPRRVRDLIRLGVAFDQRGGVLARGLEAAHSRARVLHARGDATGLSIELALVEAVRSANVVVLEHTFGCDLVVRDGRVAGLEVLGADGVRRVLEADAVVLASGGAGQLYLHTTNPAGATGDGTALAYRAGAELADVEFYQFHPTALACADTFLISEAVRGEGAVLLDAQGRRFMQALHADAELAPRDVVARGIALQMAAQGGRPVMLDATRMGAEFLRERFPSIDAACRERGFEWAKEPIPVTPAAHYWMGGVRTDLWGRTTVPGLYAIGEAACTGAHGANRLASNSLLESLVFGWRCAELLLGEDDGAWPMAASDGGEMVSVAGGSRAGSSAVDRTTLRELMWGSVGIERDGPALRAALEQLEGWRVDGGSVADLETANLLELARAVTAAALVRCESRGAHFREDYPETLEAWRRSLVVGRKVAVAC